MGGDGERTHRFAMMLNDAEMEAVDEWRFRNRVATRAEAVRRLCAIALLRGDLANSAARRKKAITP